MINVDDMYTTVGSLISKDKAGYFSNAEFNQVSKMAELLLWTYMAENYESNLLLAEDMLPFTVQANALLSTLSRTPIPTDSGAVQQLWWRRVTNSTECGINPTVDEVKIQYVEKMELANTLESPIRGPSKAAPRILWAHVVRGIQVYPNLSGQYVTFDYLRYPIYAVRGITLDVANDQENYDASTSTQYEWGDNNKTNLVDLILLHYGISIRDTAITQWAAQKQPITNHIS